MRLKQECNQIIEQNCNQRKVHGVRLNFDSSIRKDMTFLLGWEKIFEKLTKELRTIAENSQKQEKL